MPVVRKGLGFFTNFFAADKADLLLFFPLVGHWEYIVTFPFITISYLLKSTRFSIIYPFLTSFNPPLLYLLCKSLVLVVVSHRHS